MFHHSLFATLIYQFQLNHQKIGKGNVNNIKKIDDIFIQKYIVTRRIIKNNITKLNQAKQK